MNRLIVASILCFVSFQSYAASELLATVEAGKASSPESKQPSGKESGLAAKEPSPEGSLPDNNEPTKAHPYSLSRLTLSPDGRFFVSKEGNTTVLRGVNLVSKTRPYTYQAMGIDEKDVGLIRQMGLNVVRLGINWAGLEPKAGFYDAKYLEKYFETVKLFVGHGIYVLVDLHQDAYAAKHGGFGLPNWSALGKGEMDPIGFPMNEFGGMDRPEGLPATISTVIDEDFDAFWGNRRLRHRGIQDRYLSMVEYLSQEIENQNEHVRDGIIGLELMNEPFPGVDWWECTDRTILAQGEKQEQFNFSQGCKSFEGKKLTSFYKKAVKRVRDVSDDLPIWVDPVNLFGLGAPSFLDFKKISDPRNLLVFSWHHYFPLDPDVPFANVEAIHENNPKLLGSFMTEFGANSDVEQWEWILPKADQFMTSWMYWTYANNPDYPFSDTGGTIPLDGRLQGVVYDPRYSLSESIQDANGKARVNVSENIVEKLTRPYPRVTSGTPMQWNYAPSKRKFSYTYTTQGANTYTDRFVSIVTPRMCFPNGYEVRISQYIKEKLVKMAQFHDNKEELVVFHSIPKNLSEPENSYHQFRVYPNQESRIKIEIEGN